MKKNKLNIDISKSHFLPQKENSAEQSLLETSMETIVALATPPGNSGVAVIRISGKKSKEILSKLIHEDLEFEPRKMYLKNLYAGEIVDNCLVVFFNSPYSFTGEDVAEIQSHGGYLLARKIIDEVIRLGAVIATPGEFSKRAFINGKLSMDQAEGIMDLINAESEAQARVGSSLMQGALRNTITTIQESLTDVLAEIEAKLDYPEYEYTDSETTNLLSRIEKIIDELKKLISDSRQGTLIKNGIKVAIIGAPNVGKSSLLNALTKSNKAIVTDIAGTTRDVVESEYEYKGIIFRLFDTAGIHESVDIVEKIGIDRAKQILNDSDIVLFVSDDKNVCDIKTNRPFIHVFNKNDLNNNKRITSSDTIYVSAKTHENLDKLKEKIFDKTVNFDIKPNQFYITNARHIQCVENALLHLKNVLNIFNSTTMDIVSAEIKLAWQILGEITGSTSDESIIDKIFSKFCLGK